MGAAHLVSAQVPEDKEAVHCGSPEAHTDIEIFRGSLIVLNLNMRSNHSCLATGQSEYGVMVSLSLIS